MDCARKGHAKRRGAKRYVLAGAKGAPANHSQEGPEGKKATKRAKEAMKEDDPKHQGGERRRETKFDSV